jgi:hypothetical protein
MKIWILFLFASFFIGVVFARRPPGQRTAAMLGLCALVTIALYSYRWA